VIEENHVHDCGSCGIQLFLDSPAVVRNNRIFACYVGVNIEGTSKTTLDRNHLFDNETGD
jgi:Right handed beta helix region